MLLLVVSAAAWPNSVASCHFNMVQLMAGHACRPDRKNVPRPRPPPTRPGRERQKSWQEEFWENYKYPEIIPSNRYVWAASIILGAGLAWYSATLK